VKLEDKGRGARKLPYIPYVGYTPSLQPFDRSALGDCEQGCAGQEVESKSQRSSC
jgi:hypothetical protein